MNFDIGSTLLKAYSSNMSSGPTPVKLEDKQDHELDTNDRMELLNKKIDNDFLTNIYEDLIDEKKYIQKENGVEVNEYVFNDIEFLQDHYLNNDKSIFSKLDTCKTKMGSLLLKNLLIHPVEDIKVLNNRQEILKKVGTISVKLVPLMDEIKVIENDIIWFWNSTSINHIDQMNNLMYFNYDFIPFLNVNDILNNSERSLLISNIYKIVVSPLLTVLTPLISLLIPLILLFYMNRKTQMNVPFTTIFSQYIKTLFGTDTMNFMFKSKSKAMIASLVTKGIYLFMYFQNIYYSVQSSANTSKIINIIHEKLNKMTLYLKLSNKVHEICINSGINNILPYLNYDLIKNDITSYTSYFNHKLFETSPSLLSNKGKILHTFKKFRENKSDTVNIFHYTGVIDAILSINNLLKNSSEAHPYCMTKYLNRKVPEINVSDIWHPYLTQDVSSKTVKNSIDISSNILITGPNAAGKSTFIKSIITNIILAQTIGISSCSKFEITPFSLLETYLHIPDSKGSTSLFEAEMFRSKEYIEKLKNLDKSKFSFIVLDEIFSSTNYVEGFSGAYAILKKISSFKNTISITTTHYTDLEILEKDTKGKIVNYKFEVTYDKDNKILFNYLLEKGMSRQYIALDLLEKNGFDSDVIKEAQIICKKIKETKLISFIKNDLKAKDKTRKDKNRIKTG